MDWKEMLGSVEVWTGLGLILVGLAARGFGLHDLFTTAIMPFGAGLILSDAAPRAARTVRRKSRERGQR